MHTSFLIIVAVSYTGFFQNPESGKLERLISNLRGYESLYANVELEGTKTYESDDEFPIHENQFKSIKNTFKSVFQNDMIYGELLGTGLTIKGLKYTFDTYAGYDGEKTRFSEHLEFGNVVIGKGRIGIVVRPHGFLLNESRVHFPLADLLSNSPSLKFTSYDFRENETEYLGEDTFNGYSCIKVRIHTWHRSLGRDSDSPIDLWLATDRNLIPVHMEGYRFYDGTFLMIEIGSVDGFKEIETGVWYPTSSRSEIYDYSWEKPISANTRRLTGKWTHAINKINLNPNYPKEFFSNIKMPDGVPVWVLKDKKHIGSYIQGLPNNTESTSKKKRISVSAVVAIGLLSAIIISFLLYRNRRRSSIVFNNPRLI